MKYFKKISFAVLLCAGLFTSCKDDNETYIKGFSIDKTEIVVGEDGGTEKLNIQSESEWTAVSDQPWVMITPASGIGSSECVIYVDSTLINDVRTADIKISSENGERKTVKVSQIGYGKIISVNTEEVNLTSFSSYEKRYFDVSITTNVLFNININDDENWISYEKDDLDIDLNKGARPRTLKMRFKWEMNSDPVERLAKIEFLPTEGTIEKEAFVNVIQEAAPVIEDNRAGDSLALIIIQQKMGCMAEFDTAENLSNWVGVKVWEKTDKGVTSEMVGRVRSVGFQLYELNEELPLEIGKLTYLETYSVLGNMNGFIKKIKIGEAFNNLKYLKNLTLFGHGLTSLEPSLTNLKQLEYLDLGANNFSSIPSVLNATNFPSLKSLDLTGNRRSNENDLSSMNLTDIGLYLSLDKNEADRQSLINLLSWESLEYLRMSFNFIEGTIPDMEDYPVRYTAEEVNANDTLPSMLIGMPKVLPNVHTFSLNLNMLTGSLPNWALYHPYLWSWNPYSLLFYQEGFNSDGKKAGFDNEPANLDYYYEQYPLRKPTLND